MKKIFAVLAMMIGLSMNSWAGERENLQPGIYTIVNNEYIPLSLLKSSTSFDLQDEPDDQPAKVYYKGASSDVKSTGHFLLVCDTTQEEAYITNKRYDVFARFVTPDWFRLVRLQHGRMGGRYYQVSKIWPSVVGSMLGVRNVEVRPKKSRPINYEWKKVGRGMFMIDADLSEGEYAFVLNTTRDDNMLLENVFDFSVK